MLKRLMRGSSEATRRRDSQHSDRWIKPATLLYALALRAFPEPFRRRFGPEMRRVLAAQLEAAARAAPRRRWLPRARLLVRAVADALYQGLDERCHGVRPVTAAAATLGTRRARPTPPLHHHPEAPMLDRLANDLRFAVRGLRRSPAFTALAVLTLALGVGANTALFSVIDSVLLEPLPYAEPERLVRIFETNPSIPEFPVAPGNFVDYRAGSRHLAQVAAFTRQDAELSAGDAARRLSGMQVSHGFLDLLGRRPILGRDLEAGDEAPGAPPVVVLGHGFWQEHFAGDADAVGRSIDLDGIQHTIVGLAPPGLEHIGGSFRSLPQGSRIDVWRPLPLDQPQLPRNQHYLNAVARLAAGSSLGQAQAELTVLTERLESEHPGTNIGWRAYAVPLHDDVVGETGRLLWILLGAVSLVLLVVCANVANLVLVRGIGRRREVAMRGALGASRGRLLQLLLVESVVLAMAAGALGAVAAYGAVAMIRALGPASLPRLHAVEVDAGVLAFCLGLSVVTGLLVGCLPALRVSRSATTALSRSGRGATSDRATGRLRTALVAAQVALAVMLLFGASLLGRSFANVLAEDPGFGPTGVLTGSIELPRGRFADAASQRDFWSRFVPAVAALPGVESAGAGSDLPWTGHDENLSLMPEGQGGTLGSMFGVRYHQATPGFFQALGVRLLAGRSFETVDRAGAVQTVIVNESLVRRGWPDLPLEEAPGRRLTWSDEPDSGDWFTIAGVVGNVKDGPTEASTRPAVFFAYDQQPWPRKMFLAVRTSGDPAAIVGGLRQILRGIDRNLPLAEVVRLTQVADGPLAEPRFASALVATFAGVTLGFALVGLASVIAFTASQRRREVAVRVALGASAARIVRLFMRQGLAALAIGIVGGAIGAALGARALERLLFGVDAGDASLLLGVAALLALVGVAASAIPAMRATRVDPGRLLGSE